MLYKKQSFTYFCKVKEASKYNGSMVVFLTIIPIIGIVGTSFYVYYNGIELFEPILLISLWFFTGMGITMGYHRLFAHKSYRTNTILEWILMIFGSIALENTILKWSSDHRRHHSLSDTDDDPYTIKKGFWHAHIGWILKNTDPEKEKISGVKDLEKKSAVIFQNKYYFHIAFVGGFLIPLAIGFYYNRPLGGLLWGTFLRITLVHHATFFINSLCHYSGKRTYDVNSTSRDSWFVSLFTFGEGYHNYHHKFPSDYRNGIKWYAYDPSKWLIKVFSYFKITSNLIRTNDYLILQSRFEVISYTITEKVKKSNKNYLIARKMDLEILKNSANEIISKIKNLELPKNKIGTQISSDSLINYKKKMVKVLADLDLISRSLSYS